MTVTVLTDSNFTISAAGMYEYNGKQFEITAKVGGKYSGNVDGKVFRNWDKNGVKKLVGAEYKEYRKVTIPCGHADNSTCHGEHVLKVVSSNKLAKQHRKLMLALSDIKAVLPNTSDDIVNLIHSRWYEYTEEVKRMEAEAEAKKAAIAAKKQAEEDAKKQAEEQKLRRAIIEGYAKKQGITLDKAEAALIAVGII